MKTIRVVAAIIRDGDRIFATQRGYGEFKGESRTYSRNDFINVDDYYDLQDKYIQSDNNTDYVYYETDEEKSLAILTLKHCWISDHYRDVIRKMFTEIKEKNIENLAIDLRGNPGGDTYVVNELFKYLPVDTYYQGDNFRKIRD